MMRCITKTTILITLLIFNSLINYADNDPVCDIRHVSGNVTIMPAITKSDEPLGAFHSLSIPLKRAGRLFLIEACIDGQTGNLIFDTGASGLVLNRTYFRKYAGTVKTGASGVTGSFDKVHRIVVARIDIAEMYYEDVAADLADLGHIENKRGVKILGLFGINMINDFEVIFDATNNELQLNRIDKQGNRLNNEISGLKFDFFQKLEKCNNILLLKGTVGEKTLNFCLDTGAETNVISSSVSKKVLSTVKINRRSNMGGASSQSTEVLTGTMNEFESANHQFGSMETIITSLDAMSEAYGCSIDGMLGFDFWQKGVFCFNFGKNEFSFTIRKGDKK